MARGGIKVKAIWQFSYPALELIMFRALFQSVENQSALHLAGLWRGLRGMGRAALDLVYPPSCIACRRATAEPGVLCAQCWGEIRFIERPYCERLGTPFAQDFGQTLISPQAMADPPVYNRARAVARFEDGPARNLVHRLKYGDRIELARPLGRWMARAGAEILAEADILIPVPLHRRKLVSRRFNQAMALAEAISNETQLPVQPFYLARVKATRPQVGLSKVQRAENVQGAFRVCEGAELHLKGKRVILVDDVLTSGSTLNAASRVLLRGGVASVDVLVFARVVTGE
jgi:ComF family protein